MQLVILAGGGGTRLKSVSGGLPKPLVPVGGQTLLGRQIAQAAQSGVIREVLILTGHGADRISDWLRDHPFSLPVTTLAEAAPRGTAGAVYDAMARLDPTFMVMYADTVGDVDLGRFQRFHRARDADLSLFVHPNDHPADSDLVECDEEGRILAFHAYPHPPDALLPNLVNAAMYVVRKDSLMGLEGLPERPDLAKHVFPAMLKAGRRLAGYRSPEYIKDAGTPERLAKVGQDLASGLVAARALRAPAAAVFLDRDGVLNRSNGFIDTPEKLTLLPGVGEALARLNRSVFRSVVVTNQPVVARGAASLEGLRRIHMKLDTELGKAHAYVDALYFCPHHPDKGFAGEVAELKIVCDCRKPATGLAARAALDLNIALEKSWMIGDTTSDMEMARRAGLKSILVRTGEGGRDGKYAATPDLVADDLAAAVSLILNG